MVKKNSEFRPQNPLKSPRFSGIVTFSRLPWVTDLLAEKPDVAILGIPFDGAATYRPGARLGPRSIREASVLCRNYHPVQDVSVYENLKVVDGGDLAIHPLSISSTFETIQSSYKPLHEAGIRTVSLGGDHSILLPILRSIHARYGKVTLIHFDAHTDTAEQAWGEKYHHGTPVRRAIEEGLIEGKRIFQIGIRGPMTSPDEAQYCRDQGIHTLRSEEFDSEELREAYFQNLKKIAGNGPCYITFDIDGIDPAYAPGTGTPVVGGLTSREALACVRRLKGLPIVGADLVEVAPAYDQSDITSLLASALVFEFLTLMAVK